MNLSSFQPYPLLIKKSQAIILKMINQPVSEQGFYKGHICHD